VATPEGELTSLTFNGSSQQCDDLIIIEYEGVPAQTFRVWRRYVLATGHRNVPEGNVPRFERRFNKYCQILLDARVGAPDQTRNFSLRLHHKDPSPIRRRKRFVRKRKLTLRRSNSPRRRDQNRHPKLPMIVPQC
jgi:hypothetical protein